MEEKTQWHPGFYAGIELELKVFEKNLPTFPTENPLKQAHGFAIIHMCLQRKGWKNLRPSELLYHDS